MAFLQPVLLLIVSVPTGRTEVSTQARKILVESGQTVTLARDQTLVRCRNQERSNISEHSIADEGAMVLISRTGDKQSYYLHLHFELDGQARDKLIVKLYTGPYSRRHHAVGGGWSLVSRAKDSWNASE